MKNVYHLIIILLLLLQSCNKTVVTFQQDLDLLQKIDDIEVLKNENSLIAVSGSYQGRVFTSSSNGYNSRSYGYFNRDLVKTGTASKNMSKLGGEARMWFGPEIGKYAIFFAPNTEQNANTISISPELDNRMFKFIKRNDYSITYGNKMNIRNANNYNFQIDVTRKISLKTKAQINSELNIQHVDNLQSVAFSAETWIKNIGYEAWEKNKGLLSIWDIGCMLPSPNTIIIIPLSKYADSITTYFTEVDESRLIIKDNVVYYKGDAQYMNKIGIQPKFCTTVFGSYSPDLDLLNIVKFNFEDDSLYANSLWGHSKPYEGDVINIFNGEIDKTTNKNWPFFEFESSSSCKELNVGESLYHNQTIYHFEGAIENLNDIAQKVLGVSLKDLNTTKIFN